MNFLEFVNMQSAFSKKRGEHYLLKVYIEDLENNVDSELLKSYPIKKKYKSYSIEKLKEEENKMIDEICNMQKCLKNGWD